MWLHSLVSLRWTGAGSSRNGRVACQIRPPLVALAGQAKHRSPLCPDAPMILARSNCALRPADGHCYLRVQRKAALPLRDQSDSAARASAAITEIAGTCADQLLMGR